MNNPRPETPAARTTPTTVDPAPPGTALDAAAPDVSASPVPVSIETASPVPVSIVPVSPVPVSPVPVSIETEVPRNPLPKIIPFDGLARCGDEVWIENAGQIYRLRRTRQGKLILTK